MENMWGYVGIALPDANFSYETSAAIVFLARA
jgi:hypothetical protein